MEIGWLDDLPRDSAGAYGCKGARLGELTRLGMPVPAGFIVASSIYAAHVERRGLAKTLAHLVESRDWEAAEQTARDLIGSGPLENGLGARLAGAHRRLGEGPVAVRSSATAEDLAGASFAGQYRTVLGVRGEPALQRAVRECWTSLWSRRALEYRDRRSIDHFSCRMAVIVQTMLPADVTGVIFTTDPVTHRSDRILIECARGAGEGIVAGTSLGQVYRVDRSTLTIVEGEGGAAVLSPGEIAKLCRWALDLEAHFGSPQDVEFASVGSQLFLLQARPITTLDRVLPDRLEPLGKPRFLDRVVKSLVTERYVIAPRPLDNITYTRLVGASVHSLRRNGVNVTAEDEAAFRAQVWHQAYRYPRHRLTWRFLFSGFGQLRMLRAGLLPWWQSGPAISLRGMVLSADLGMMGDAALLRQADEILAIWEKALHSRMYAASALQWETWLRGLVTVAVGRRRSAQVLSNLLSGMSSPTLEVNRALWGLSRQARRQPDILAGVREMAPDRLRETRGGRSFLAAVDDFLDACGHREGIGWYLSTPTWRVDPGPVWRLLRGLAEAEEPPLDPAPALVRYRVARQLVERRLRLLPGMPRFFRWLVEAIRDLTAFREQSHFDLTRALVPLQLIAAEWGRRLVQRGVLGTADDVFYLTHEEVRRWLPGLSPGADVVRNLVARRRATYEVVNARWQAERQAGASRGGPMEGIGASAGVARGRVRIVRSEAEFDRLRPGEVLVCPQTNPSWTVLFAFAAAIVTETGGPASHAAIVAREYGIPAVMGVEGATRLIEDGDEVLVDGHQATVRRLDAGQAAGVRS